MSQNLRFLLIEDNSVDRFLITRKLSAHIPGVRVEPIVSTLELARALATGEFDLVISNARPSWTDITLLSCGIKARWPACPIILLVNIGDEKPVPQTSHTGQEHRIVKSSRYVQRLIRTIQLTLGIDIRERAPSLAQPRVTGSDSRSQLPTSYLSDTMSEEDLEVSHLERETEETAPGPARAGPRQNATQSTAAVNGNQKLGYQHAEPAQGVEQLAAGIAHQFNNVLQTIVSSAELAILHLESPTAARQDLQRILDQSWYAAHVVRQLLDFGYPSTPEKRPLHLVPFIHETIRGWEDSLPQNIQVALTVEPSREDYLLDADPIQLRQVLTNLAINARDAMLEGGKLHIRLFRLTANLDQRSVDLKSPVSAAPGPGGERIVLSVTDSGTGIPPHVLPHIFEPFFTTKEVGQGSGMGLAQVSGIVKRHGGHIDVESQAGEGTTVTISFPTWPAASWPQATGPRGIALEGPDMNALLPWVPESDPTTNGPIQ